MSIKTTALRALCATIRALSPEARHLFDRDGSCYMRRWHVIREGTYASRLLERLTGYTSVRLHHIVQGDRDRDLHNHPFAYRTLVLVGDYVEQFKRKRSRSTSVRTVRAGQTAELVQSLFHRIDSVSPGGVWTLFCMTRNTGEWGFLCDGRYVPSVSYFKRRGFDKTNPR